MYSTCIFCNRSLGTNEAVEHFPVGRRLAFDAAKGRLWAVCAACGRWNLTPIEERWEAIEDCERLFDAARLRASSEHVGLGRVAEGTELIRVGAPKRPELAAWRYGRHFGRRRTRANAIALGIGAVAAGAALMPIAAPVFGAISGMSLVFAVAAASGVVPERERVAIVRSTAGRDAVVRGKHVKGALLVRTVGGWSLRLPHDGGRAELEGEEATRALTILLAALNRAGGDERTVRSAVDTLETAGSTEAVFDAALDGQQTGNSIIRGGLSSLSRPMRLALEMAVHEASERRALEGELATLEESWRRAEEIAAIADDMFLPAGVRGWLAGKKG
jgi:hypothetical protein